MHEFLSAHTVGPSRKGDVLARYEKQQQQQQQQLIHVCPCIEIKETTGRLSSTQQRLHTVSYCNYN